MITLRKASERGRSKIDWLDSRHTFSFAEYYDPEHVGFRNLRVINDDRVAPGQGFGTHGHRDMEIISYVLEGALEHKDSMGNGSIIKPGDVQRMTAGTGVRHSEYNASKKELVHFLQIWILPGAANLAPGYEQKTFLDRQGKLVLVASPKGESGSVTLHADARLFATILGPGEKVRAEIPSGRSAWVHVASGKARVAKHELAEGDGAAFEDENAIDLEGIEKAEILVFDLP
jgi:redox-sensitive bicupin YhaK (pirin superfamily)